MLFPMHNQQCQSTKGNRMLMLICWVVNTSFKPQGYGHCSINCCCVSTAFDCCKPNKPSPTVNCRNCSYVCSISLCTNVFHNRQLSLLRCCLLEERVKWANSVFCEYIFRLMNVRNTEFSNRFHIALFDILNHDQLSEFH